MAKTVRALVVAGGGAGGAYRSTYGTGGGGGAGGMQDVAGIAVASLAYTVTVGAGGIGHVNTEGANGGNSSFATVTSTGGGGGGSRPPTSENQVALSTGKDGGSGGGSNTTAGALFGYGVVGQGKNGRAATNATYSGGGGGAGKDAGYNNGESRFYANGGHGVASTITGTSVAYAGGGAGWGGNASVLESNGTYGGGGKYGESGVANTGGGGGGGGGSPPGAGGSGVVIIRYVTADFGTCTGGSKTTDGSDTVHTFNSSGTFTVVYLPISTTQAPTEVQALTALGNGTITDAGDANATERGFVWGTTTQSTPGNVAPASTTYDDYVTETGTFSAGTFTGTLDGLIAATTHYVRAYARNATGYAYGNEKQFVTITAPNAPSLTTTPATVLATTSATLNGNIVDEGVAAVTEQGFVYDTRSISLPGNVHPLYSGYRLYTSETGAFVEGAFSDPVSDLTLATTYYARSFAKNTGGYSYGNQVSFSTIDLNDDSITSISLTNDSVTAVNLTNDNV